MFLVLLFHKITKSLQDNMNKKVIVTGITGQTGSYMVDYLLKNTDYDIYGAIRRLSVDNHQNINHLKNNPRFKLIEMDLCDSESIEASIREIKPDYYINFAANSFVGTSWKLPVNHFQSNTMAVLHQLEAIRKHVPHCRYYNSGSSEEFGDVSYSPQDERHPLRPRSPYGASKASSRHIVKVWRESYNLYAIQGHLFNHESPRRGHEFVTRKITLAVANMVKEIKAGLPPTPLILGNLDTKRDWSHAADFVRGIWMMMNQELYRVELQPELYREHEYDKTVINSLQEYVLSSNETHTVREFLEACFKFAEINIDDVNPLRLPPVDSDIAPQVNYVFSDNKEPAVLVSKAFYRPAEVNLLWGDSSLVKKDLGWKPNYSFNDLVAEMMMSDLL
jgi:GDPmannose 4,6-dehydratase